MTMGENNEAKREAARGKLDAGSWLLPGELGALFGVTRFKANYWLNNGMVVAGERFAIRHRPRTLGTYRECNPEDVRAALAAYERALAARDSAED